MMTRREQRNWKFFGREIRMYRTECTNLSIRKLAKKVRCSPATLCRVENGHEPSANLYIRLCEWYGGMYGEIRCKVSPREAL